jgi:mRNA interferase YafQ
MASKRTPQDARRAIPPRASDYAKEFLKDWDSLSRSGRFSMRQLKEAMMLLIANEEQLGPEWLDHVLKGEWAGYRECHIGGDFLLIYRIEGKGSRETIFFVRAGTHAQLFE